MSRALHRCLLLVPALSVLVCCTGRPTPDAFGTGVAVHRAVAATLHAEAQATAIPLPTVDLVATAIAVHQAVAATLTAAAPPATRTPAPIASLTPDQVATGVAVQMAVAATLTAGAPPATSAPPRLPTDPETAEPIRPTDTPSPVPTKPSPLPTKIAPAPTALPCITWSQAADYLGSFQCVCGVVHSTYDDPDSAAFFINFGPERTGYYAISFEIEFEGIEGKCIRVCGTVETYQGRPQTIIHSPDQLQEMLTCPVAADS